VIDGSFALAFTAGMVATVNPCGFAMLPAYLSYFLGIEASADDGKPATARFSRAIIVSMSVSAGFLFVFTLIGAITQSGFTFIIDGAKYLTIVIGLAMVVLGVAMLLGYRLPYTTPKLDKGGRDRTIASMTLFGISYAIASIGCTLPTFGAIVIGSFGRNSFTSGMLMVAAYGAGMALVLTALTVTLALARGGLLVVLRKGMRYVDRFAAVFLILAGTYLVYYWVYNLSTNSGVNGNASGGVADRVEGWSASAARWIQERGAWTMLVLLIAVIAVTAVVALARRPRTGSTAA
jgi:cytochrome c-type biogenesis protein